MPSPVRIGAGGESVAWCYPSSRMCLACRFGSHGVGAAAYIATVWGGVQMVWLQYEERECARGVGIFGDVSVDLKK